MDISGKRIDVRLTCLHNGIICCAKALVNRLIIKGKIWIIRGNGDKRYDDFRDKQVVAIGWSQFAPHVKSGLSRSQLLIMYQELEPQVKLGSARSGTSQIWRFVNEIQKGD